MALAMDAFAVSIASGVYLCNVTPRQFFRLSWHFGLFQGMMPVIGWYAGGAVRGWIEQYDHWVAFTLLTLVSGDMLWQSFEKAATDCVLKDPSKGFRLVMLSVATSIDALAVGLSFSVLNVSIWLPALVIGITAAGFTLAGLLIGSRAEHVAALRRYSAMTGALVLFVIGVRILYAHGVF